MADLFETDGRTIATGKQDLKAKIIHIAKQNPYFLNSLTAVKFYKQYGHLDKSITIYSKQIINNISDESIRKRLTNTINKKPVENFMHFNDELLKIIEKNPSLSKGLSAVKMHQYDSLGKKI
ncbi:hypothetical protein N9B72_01755 [Bacteriovoracaceae bacterium]|nr:hypothetical protein [Bacteriovoracaceae bacterium]